MPDCPDCKELRETFSCNKIWSWSETPWTRVDRNDENRTMGGTRHMFYQAEKLPLCKMWWETGRPVRKEVEPEPPDACFCAASQRPPCSWCTDPARTEADVR